MKPNEVSASKIKAENLHVRAGINHDYVAELTERMEAGDSFPAIDVFTDGEGQWLADGLHRLTAGIQANKKIGVTYRKGTKAEAIEFACNANAAHGLRRSPADKRASVCLALLTFPDRSSRSIAELCAVGQHLVAELKDGQSKPTPPTGQVRARAPEKPSINIDSPKKVTGADGKKYPARQTPKSGSATVTVKQRKALHASFGQMIRAMDALNIRAEFDVCLEQIAKRIKTL